MGLECSFSGKQRLQQPLQVIQCAAVNYTYIDTFPFVYMCMTMANVLGSFKILLIFINQEPKSGDKISFACVEHTLHMLNEPSLIMNFVCGKIQLDYFQVIL